MDFERIREHEQVIVCHEPSVGLKAIIAIHSTALGPALGGCRMFPYATFDEALEDALRLSKGMTYKCAATGLDFGGGKAVIVGDPETDKSPELFRAFGQQVASLNGRFYTGTDMGTTPEDFVHALSETDCIVGIPETYGGHGDSSIPTSQGVLYGLRATLKFLQGTENLGDFVYAVQGLGKVGYKVAAQLLDEGASLVVSESDQKRIDELLTHAERVEGHVEVASQDGIYDAKADIFIPCAIGGILNDETVNRLQVKAVVGSANNQLRSDRQGEVLHERGILYAPDYIVNTGGLIQVADELRQPNKERVLEQTQRIYTALLEIYRLAAEEGVSTVTAANRLCETRIARRKERNHFFLSTLRPKWRLRT